VGKQKKRECKKREGPTGPARPPLEKNFCRQKEVDEGRNDLGEGIPRSKKRRPNAFQERRRGRGEPETNKKSFLGSRVEIEWVDRGGGKRGLYKVP